MKRLYIVLNFLCITLFAAKSQVFYTPETLPNVHLQNEHRHLCNPDGIISLSAQDSIDIMLHRLREQTGIEVVVAVINSIGDADCFEFSHTLFNSWGVGKNSTNNGLVVLLVTDQRCIQMVTGYGLEGILPDAICKRIQIESMIPYLKQENWDQGMVHGVADICRRLDGTMINESPSHEDDTFFPMILFMGFFLVGILFVWLAARNASKCPQCGKHNLQRVSSQVISHHAGIKVEEVIYICQDCGHTLTRRQNTYDENHHHRNRGRGIFIGGGGFGGNGRGFSGGSFGGGMSGGGGAGSRF